MSVSSDATQSHHAEIQSLDESGFMKEHDVVRHLNVRVVHDTQVDLVPRLLVACLNRKKD